jgi:hypothetical protein
MRKSSRLSPRPQITSEPKPPFAVQHQKAPGRESRLDPAPRWQAPRYLPAGKLAKKIALITGGDSGIGRAVAYMYAREGADVAINFLPVEKSDAIETKRAVESTGRKCLLLPADLSRPGACEKIVAKTLKHFGQLDILVSNAAHHLTPTHPSSRVSFCRLWAAKPLALKSIVIGTGAGVRWDPSE